MPRFKSISFYQNSSKIKLFLQKNAKFSIAGAVPPDPRASGGWGLFFQIPIGFRLLGASLPDPKNSPTIANFWLRACEEEMH